MENVIENNRCEWCGCTCEKLHEYQNNNYSGKFCEPCLELVDLASEAVEKDNS